ncbi:MAG: phospho-sugar mutase, partial [Actinomycetota bacterium]|nr:phospho-sugar mutase [Actinomycetota bacterium]
ARIGDAPPTVIAGASVTAVTDFRTGADARPSWLGEHDLVAFTLDEGRVMIRPSGTEPKCKIYVDVRGELAPDASLADIADAERALAARAAELALDLARVAGL